MFLRHVMTWPVWEAACSQLPHSCPAAQGDGLSAQSWSGVASCPRPPRSISPQQLPMRPRGGVKLITGCRWVSGVNPCGPHVGVGPDALGSARSTDGVFIQGFWVLRAPCPLGICWQERGFSAFQKRGDQGPAPLLLADGHPWGQGHSFMSPRTPAVGSSSPPEHPASS